MKLKTLLLGSAASLMAATSSFAADAVIAEPEAVEFVRVCDAYGAGYFFIPGTERCLKLSGEVRFEYRIDDRDRGSDDDVDGEWAYRARFAINSANESDFGTIRTYIRFEANYGDPLRTSTGFSSQPLPARLQDGTDDIQLAQIAPGRDVGLQAMTLSIGGLEVGIFDNYWSKNNGYGNLFAMADGYYGYDQALYAQYTYEIAGFAVTAGVEQTQDDDSVATLGGDLIPNFAGDELNIYAGASYGASFGDFAATVYYDNFRDDFGYKFSGLIKPIEGLSVKGWYLGGDGFYVNQATGDASSDYAYGVSAAYTFGDFTPYIGYSDTDDGGNPGFIAGGVVYSPSSTDGLTIQGEVNYVTEGDINPSAYRVRLIKSF